jgi:N-acetylglutamate synthase-like GNAT family acetyltransferase
MSAENIRMSKAGEVDLSDLLALLTAVGLPHEGVTEHLGSFFVARNPENKLIACAGIESYGKLGLLRSVAVLPDSQQTGIGSKLTALLLEDAAKAGIEEVLLLTTTARDFFARRFGFLEANRADYNERLTASQEWSLPRCSSAVFMRLPLKQKA